MKFGEHLIFSAAIGAIVTAALYSGSAQAEATGHLDLANRLWWHGDLLVDMATRNAGAPDDPSPGFAKLMSFPLGLLVYGTVAFVLLRVAGRKS